MAGLHRRRLLDTAQTVALIVAGVAFLCSVVAVAVLITGGLGSV